MELNPTPEIFKEKNHYLVRVGQEKQYKIPSQMFPLKDLPDIFTSDNTEDLDDEAVKNIFDSVEFRLGLCYSNTEALITKFKEAGIAGAEPYAGWIIPPNGLPVHHCFVLYRKKHILDPSAIVCSGDLLQLLPQRGEKLREDISDFYVKRQHLPNSERGTFGKASDLYLYIASRQDPGDALKMIRKIIEIYPNHPSYRNADERGYNRTIKRIYEKMGTGVSF